MSATTERYKPHLGSKVITRRPKPRRENHAPYDRLSSLDGVRDVQRAKMKTSHHRNHSNESEEDFEYNHFEDEDDDDDDDDDDEDEDESAEETYHLVPFDPHLRQDFIVIAFKLLNPEEDHWANRLSDYLTFYSHRRNLPKRLLRSVTHVELLVMLYDYCYNHAFCMGFELSPHVVKCGDDDDDDDGDDGDDAYGPPPFARPIKTPTTHSISRRAIS
ncbi:hypothetical protein CYMTET_2690 [Cymbomonas tetramitiformis]|uniref:Uncharacterized protein n=1 Tax=Cymbomonas tetramitiformis TaxID=36881 RepID=A0AAE0LM48_9CHLO|nr:hypothetical protein CYMTET_2690 [Cymbomonas tetramitiformis]